MKRKVRKDRTIKFPEPDFLPELDKETHKWREREHTRFVFYLSLLGCTEAQIAQSFGIGKSTFDRWKRTKPKFLEAMRQGKMEADGKVAHSLYLASIGYSHPDQVILPNRIKEYDPNTGKVIREYTEPLIVDTVKNYPPNAAAAIKWLQARQSEIWGKRITVKGQIDHKHQVDLTKVSDEELKVLRKLTVSTGENEIEDVNYTE